MQNRFLLVLGMGVGLAGCGADEETGATAAGGAEPAAEHGVSAGAWDARLAAEELEQGRLDAAWQRVVELDTMGLGSPAVSSTETFDQISPQAVNTGPMTLPLYGDVEGPSVLRLQVLLDRALFSPGIIDGHWGKNTEKALYWFQHREGLRRTGRLDETTFERLAEVAGGAPELVRSHTLTAADVEGPFVTVPEDIYEKAELDCLCYESLEEKLAEQFHTSVEVLAQLNPDITLSSLTAGAQLQVPAVREATAGQGMNVARIVISAEGFYVHALDASDRILYHFPSTMGSSFDPSPTGDHTVANIAPDPAWHYQPSILESVPDDEPEAMIPPGPNNAVGVVWMALSIEHYGIHGTSAPETIGYTTSAGCIRLTNWDALFLSERIAEGVPVEFRNNPGAANPASTG